MAPDESLALEIIINIFDNKLASIAYSQKLPLKSFAKKHVEANIVRKTRSLITQVACLCHEEKRCYFRQRLEYETGSVKDRLKWYSGSINAKYDVSPFIDIVELLSIITNRFSAVTKRRDIIHLELTETDDKIWKILLEISLIFSSMLVEAHTADYCSKAHSFIDERSKRSKHFCTRE